MTASSASLPPEHRTLAQWGWSETHQEWFDGLSAEDRSRYEPGRVIKELRGVLEVGVGEGVIEARIPGRFFRPEAKESAIPTVGDWVLIPRDRAPGGCWIEAVMPRRSKFSRKAAGSRTREQVVTANIDDLFIVMGLDGDFNPRRLERYLSAAHDSGAEPVVVLNKADVALERGARHELGDRYRQVTEIAGESPIYVVSSKAEIKEELEQLDAEGIDQLRERLRPGRTIAFVGSSGVGKSTLVNTLFGKEVMKVRRVRERDDRGQHTTSHRELLQLPDGSLLVDNPGIRELQGWEVEEGLEQAFEEIRRLATDCRFRDCRHEAEPGCAVRAAASAGELDAERLEHFRRLENEAREQEERRADRARAQETFVSRHKKSRKTRRGRRRD